MVREGVDVVRVDCAGPQPREMNSCRIGFMFSRWTGVTDTAAQARADFVGTAFSSFVGKIRVRNHLSAHGNDVRFTVCYDSLGVFGSGDSTHYSHGDADGLLDRSGKIRVQTVGPEDG